MVHEVIYEDPSLVKAKGLSFVDVDMKDHNEFWTDEHIIVKATTYTIVPGGQLSLTIYKRNVQNPKLEHAYVILYDDEHEIIAEDNITLYPYEELKAELSEPFQVEIPYMKDMEYTLEMFNRGDPMPERKQIKLVIYIDHNHKDGTTVPVEIEHNITVEPLTLFRPIGSGKNTKHEAVEPSAIQRGYIVDKNKKKIKNMRSYQEHINNI